MNQAGTLIWCLISFLEERTTRTVNPQNGGISKGVHIVPLVHIFIVQFAWICPNPYIIALINSHSSTKLNMVITRPTESLYPI